MDEVILQFESAIAADDGRRYRPHACGRLLDDGHRWEGWIEFAPIGGGQPLVTARETVQPNRRDLVYWATGLSHAYLQGALRRAGVATRRTRPGGVPPVPRRSAARPPPRGTAVPRPRTIIDPFHVYLQGEEVLRQELGAMSFAHLRNIAVAYDLLTDDPSDPAILSRPEFVERIVASVRDRLLSQRR